MPLKLLNGMFLITSEVPLSDFSYFRHVLHAKKTAFIVEHDFIMSTYLADRVIVMNGTPAVDTLASPPKSLLSGMNEFLKHLNITFRRDNESHRPRINKLESVKDNDQKRSGNYFFLDDD